MRVAVEHGAHRVAVQRVLESAGAEERIDLRRLAGDRAEDGRIVQHRHTVLRAQARERGFELERLVDRLVHEVLDAVLAPRRERARSEAAREALHAREADARHFLRVAVEQDHPDVDENLLHLVRITRFEVVVAEHGHHRDPHRLLERGRDDARLFRQPVVGDVAAENEHVRRGRRRREHRLQPRVPGARDVRVTDGRHADHVFHGRSTTLMHSSSLSRNMRYPRGASSSAIRCVITSEGSISSRWMRPRSGRM